MGIRKWLVVGPSTVLGNLLKAELLAIDSQSILHNKSAKESNDAKIGHHIWTVAGPREIEEFGQFFSS